MRFGAFDHIDDNGQPLAQQLADRLRLVEVYDKAGYETYHLAEHHGTPLGRVPSPGVFLAAVAARTEKIKPGPLVYVLPAYEPLRLIEEICILDHLSGGRFQLGVGKGASLIENGFFGVDPATAQDRFLEALDVIRTGLDPATESLTYDGGFYHYDDVPMTLKPLQSPHPPLWFGIAHAEHADWAAENDASIVALTPAPLVREITDRYRARWDALGKSAAALPHMGVMRLLVIAESEQEALELADRAYKPWRYSIQLLWDQRGVTSSLAGLPREFAGWMAAGGAFAGTPAQAQEWLAADAEAAGATYLVADLAFGDMSFDEARRSAELLAGEVMPALP